MILSHIPVLLRKSCISQEVEQPMKKGLILEGGAMRGMFTAGILDVLMEEGIVFDGAIGVSAGAAFGCNYKSNQPGRALRYNLKYSKDWRYCSMRSLLLTGDLFGADFCYHQIPNQLDLFDNDTYNASPMEFYVVCTDVTTGKAVYHKCETAVDENLEWIRASASLPLVARIVTIGDQQLLDGGIADSIPLAYFQSIGYDKNLVVLTQPLNYKKSPNKALPLIRMVFRKFPHLVQAVANRHLQYNQQRDYVFEEAKKGATMILCPDEPLPINRVEHDPAILQQVYDLGRKKALSKLSQIKEFLSGEPS